MGVNKLPLLTPFLCALCDLCGEKGLAIQNQKRLPQRTQRKKRKSKTGGYVLPLLTPFLCARWALCGEKGLAIQNQKRLPQRTLRKKRKS